MKKLAIFVEGQTEQIFVKKLLEEIVGRKQLKIRLEKLIGGSKIPRQVHISENIEAEEDAKYFVLICDSSNDSKVVSDVREQVESLSNKGFEKVLGLRDLYPKGLDDLARVKRFTTYGIPTRFIPVNIIIAVREVETWFIAETTHFGKMDITLDLDKINRDLGLDLTTADIELEVEEPAKMLNSIYELASLNYNKKKGEVVSTVDALCYENIYLNVKNSLASLDELVNEIDGFLS